MLGPDRERLVERARNLLGRHGAHRLKPLIAVPAAGMLEALTNRDGLDSVVEACASLDEDGLHAENCENFVVEPQLALLHELHHSSRCKRLADIGNAE
jgi:hypothetical protein